MACCGCACARVYRLWVIGHQKSLIPSINVCSSIYLYCFYIICIHIFNIIYYYQEHFETFECFRQKYSDLLIRLFLSEGSQRDKKKVLVFKIFFMLINHVVYNILLKQ